MDRLAWGELAHCLIDAGSGNLLAVDARVAAWLGCLTTECPVRRIDDLLPELGPIEAAIEEAALQPLGRTTLVATHDGGEFLAVVNCRTMAGPAGEVCLITIEQVPQRPAIQRDALTGLPDRRELAPHRQRWGRDAGGEAVPHALLFMDLDEFKQVNDTHGHAVGDRVLATLASRWSGCIRDDDLLVRYGGDEFVVLLAGIRSLAEVEPVRKRLTEATSQPLDVDGVELRVDVTIGVALAVDVAEDLEQLLATADRDLYAAKRQT